ncbi:MAG: metal-sensitive transcriptional regulator [Candidatus Dojkabacteria bacterium]|nr:metal-sensitive transcriptional regulator [Candidatus Dojkabacteria bacterium]MDQ7020270.1 metal-sensitive transcriptional regulator [Candidatus Dojkabacteria bacterium]
MSTTCLELNKNIKNRVARLKGQIAGVEKMVNDGRGAIDIVTQIAAIKSSLSSLAVEILKEESKECLNVKDKKNREESFEAIVTNLFKIN